MPKKNIYIRSYNGKQYDIRNLPKSLVYDRLTRRIRKRKVPYNLKEGKKDYWNRYNIKKRTMLKRKTRQTGSSVEEVDEKLSAFPPGKRVSATGNIYTETRANRSDISKRRRL